MSTPKSPITTNHLIHRSSQNNNNFTITTERYGIKETTLSDSAKCIEIIILEVIINNNKSSKIPVSTNVFNYYEIDQVLVVSLDYYYRHTIFEIQIIDNDSIQKQ
ncbi:hypothetical protein ACTA71_010628 [Dictyostelium dimigraforme]